jgi:uncharacterized delta-60 repeat protein
MTIKIDKVLNTLPETIESNTVYFRKKGNSVYTEVSDNSASPSIKKFKAKDVVHVVGVTSLLVNDTENYTITDYDSFKTYNITPISGTVDTQVNQFDGTFNYTAPSTQGPGGFIINGRQFNVDIITENTAPSFFFMSTGVMFRNMTTQPGQQNDEPVTTIVDSSGKILTSFINVEWNTNYNSKALITRLDSSFNTDLSFNTTGVNDLQIGYIGTPDDRRFLNSLYQTSNGKYILTGTTFIENATYATSEPKFTVVRLNNNGTLDTNFGTGGFVQIGLGSHIYDSHPIGVYFDVIAKSYLTSDDKILMTGAYHDGTKYIATIFKLNSDGTFDTNFGTAGVVSFNIGGSDTFFETCLVLIDGKILATGLSLQTSLAYSVCLVRFNSDGTLDTTFADNGVYSTIDKVDNATAVNSEETAVLSDGSIVVVGSINTKACVLKFSSLGSLIATYTNNNPSSVVYSDVYVDNNDNIYLTGIGFDINSGQNQLLVTKLNSDMSVNNAFGVDGHFTRSLNFVSEGVSIVPIATNKLLITVRTYDISEVYKTCYMQLDSNGVLDSTFGETQQDSTGNLVFINSQEPVPLNQNIHISDVNLDSLNSGLGNYNGVKFLLSRDQALIITADLPDYTEVGDYPNDNFSFTGNYRLESNGNIVRISNLEVIGHIQNTNPLHQPTWDVSKHYSRSYLYATISANLTTDEINLLIRSIVYGNDFGLPETSNYFIKYYVTDNNINDSQGPGGVLSAVGYSAIYVRAGVVLTTYCDVFNKMGTYANGTGGTYDNLIESDSLDCGYTPAANQPPVITFRSTANYFPNETLILDPNADIVDPELSQLIGTDSLLNEYLGVYNGMTFSIERVGGGSADDYYLLTAQSDKGNVNGNSSIITSELPLIPTWSIGSGPMSTTMLDGNLTWYSHTSYNAAFDLGAFQLPLTNFIQSLSYRYMGSGEPTIDLLLTVDDGNTGAQGSGGNLTHQAVISLVPPTLLIHDTFTDTNAVLIHDHVPDLGSTWIRGYDIINNYLYLDSNYIIVSNTLQREDWSNASGQENYIWNDLTLTTANTELEIQFTLTTMSTWFELGLLHRLFQTTNQAEELVFDTVKVMLNLSPSGSYTLQVTSYYNPGDFTMGSDVGLTTGTHTLKSRLVGDTIKVFIDNVLLLTHTFLDQNGTIPSLPGKVGFILNNQDNLDVVSLDNFKAKGLI